MQFTVAEAAIIEGINRALETERFNPHTTFFTARHMASEVSAMLGHTVSDRMIIPILDRMGAFAHGRGKSPHRRSIAVLRQALPKALEDAKDAGTQTLTLVGF